MKCLWWEIVNLKLSNTTHGSYGRCHSILGWTLLGFLGGYMTKHNFFWGYLAGHDFFWEVRGCMTWAWLFGRLHDWAWLFLGSAWLGMALSWDWEVAWLGPGFIWGLRGCMTWARFFFSWGLRGCVTWTRLYLGVERLRDLGTAFSFLFFSFWDCVAWHGFIWGLRGCVTRAQLYLGVERLHDLGTAFFFFFFFTGDCMTWAWLVFRGWNKFHKLLQIWTNRSFLEFIWRFFKIFLIQDFKDCFLENHLQILLFMENH